MEMFMNKHMKKGKKLVKKRLPLERSSQQKEKNKRI